MSKDTDPDSRLRLLLAVLLGLALVAAVVWLVLAVQERGESADPVQDDRDTVMLHTREYVRAAWNYGPDDLDDSGQLTAYRDRVHPLITTSFRSEFDTTVPVLDQLVAKERFARSTSVDQIGVQSLEADRAEVIVGGEISEAQRDKAKDPIGYLWLIKLQRIDGDWLVSDLDAYQGDAP